LINSSKILKISSHSRSDPRRTDIAAFAADTPSHITAAACDVCSAWIGSGVARNLEDLRRVYQLLVTSLTKLKPKLNSQRQVIFNESALTLEKLSILKAWAEVYIVSMKNEIVLRSNFDTLEENITGGGDEDDEFGDLEESNSTTINNNTDQGKLDLMEQLQKRQKEGLGSLVGIIIDSCRVGLFKISEFVIFVATAGNIFLESIKIRSQNDFILH
jgi:hypothetical protein